MNDWNNLWHTVDMIGAIVIAIIILIVIPVGFLMSTTAVAGVVGCLLTKNAEAIHADGD